MKPFDLYVSDDGGEIRRLCKAILVGKVGLKLQFVSCVPIPISATLVHFVEISGRGKVQILLGASADLDAPYTYSASFKK